MSTMAVVRTFLRHPSNLVIVAMIASAAAYAALTGGPAAFAWGAWPLLGAALFVMNEYTLHRRLLHMPVPDPVKHPFLFKHYFRLHYGHHEDPTNIPLVFAPLWFTLPMAVVNLAVIVLVLWFVPFIESPVTTATAILTGSFALFLYYEWVHMVDHLPVQPRFSFGKYMKKYHLWHHYKNEELWFGVTNPLMDLVCGTFKAPGEVPTSPTARRLGDIDPLARTAALE